MSKDNMREYKISPLISWFDLQTLAIGQWSQQLHEDIGGSIAAGINFPPSPPMNTGTQNK